MKHFCLLFFITIYTLGVAQDSLNVELFANVKRDDVRYSGCWVYQNDSGEEYALIGAKTGTAIFAIDQTDAVNELAFIPGPATNWREIMVIADHAYVVTDVQDTGHTLQVIDLGNLPEEATLVTSYNTTFETGHIVQKDIFEEAPYIYVSGTNTTGGVHMLDVSTPSNPIEIGVYNPGYYIHDCHVRGDRLYAAAFFEETIDIVDISDRSNPVVLQRISYPGTKTHSFSTTPDGKYLFIADELDGTLGRIWNVEDLENPFEVATYSANLESLVHNPYIQQDFAYIAHNTEGLRIVDVVDSTVPVEVGYYETWEGPSGGFNGLWSACPYAPSGKIIGADRTKGLFVWTFDTVYATRVYLTFQDTLSGELLPGVISVSADTNLTIPISDFWGASKFGRLPGNLALTFQKEGYLPKAITLEMIEGGMDSLLIELMPNTVATNEWTTIQGLRIYPTIWEHNLLVDWHEPPQHPYTIRIFDSKGQQQQYLQHLNSPSYMLPRSNLPKGIYWIEVVQDQKKLVQRVVIP